MNYKTIVASVVLITLSGCDWFSSSAQKTTPKFYLVNVLSKELFNDAHIEHSINAPFEQLLTHAEKWDKKVPVVLYCSNYLCTASKEGVSMLKEKGFESVRAYEGGTAEWYQLSKKDPEYRIVGPAQQKYLVMEIEPVVDGVPSIHAAELKDLIKQATL
jgi:rhodanese-related sulfurtransferase